MANNASQCYRHEVPGISAGTSKNKTQNKTMNVVDQKNINLKLNISIIMEQKKREYCVTMCMVVVVCVWTGVEAGKQKEHRFVDDK